MGKRVNMIYLGSDHRGYELKEKVKAWLSDWGYDFQDMGPDGYDKNDDYPDFAENVARKVTEGDGNKGILICGSGIGIAIAANKIKGIRAGTATSPEQVKAAVNDEDLNVLALSVDYTPENGAEKIIEIYLKSEFSNEERHLRRVNKIKKLENE